MTRTAAANGHRELRLVLIYRGDFRKNEWTLYQEAVKELGRELREGETIMLLSGTEKVVRFVYAAMVKDMVVNRAGRPMAEPVVVLPSHTYRITGGGVWHPFMIQNYAQELGLTLKNLKTLDQHIKREEAAS